jgi:hypothetical protein
VILYSVKQKYFQPIGLTGFWQREASGKSAGLFGVGYGIRPRPIA